MPKLISKTDKIIEELEYQARPMTGVEIAELTGVDSRSVTSLINQHIQRGMKPEINIVGYTKGKSGSPKNLYRIFEPADRGEQLREREDEERRRQLSLLVVPFRDHMLFLTAGRQP